MKDTRPLTVAELAAKLDGTAEGETGRTLERVDTLDQAGPESLSWLGDMKYLAQMIRSKAGAVLVPRKCALPTGRTVIRVADPDAAAAQVQAWFAPPQERVPNGIDRRAWVHPDASVEGAAIGPGVFVGAGASVGPGTQLYPGVFVGEETTIGRDCVIWPNVVIRERVQVGDRVVVHANTTIGSDGFGYLQRDGEHCKIPQTGIVVIEDNVEIGANCAIDRARLGATRIGRATKIDNLVQIAHNVEIGHGCIITGQCGIAGSSRLGNFVMLGGQAGVIDHLELSDGAQVAAKSCVFKNIPAEHAVRGIPAVEHHEFLREQASVRKLPQWTERLRRLEECVRQMTNGNSGAALKGMPDSPAQDAGTGHCSGSEVEQGSE